ncbi:MAG: D-alanyl-D-alanine carboxypeptidase family protein [Gammaproteobacteria bacterium]
MKTVVVMRWDKGLWFASAWLSVVLMASLPGTVVAGYAVVVVDAKTGRVLREVNADERNYPASLTKMMTLYLVFEALEDGRLLLGDRLRVSRHAASMTPTRLGLKTGQRIRVEDAILALVTRSANDAAVVLAEALGESEAQFARIMTGKAQWLGMSDTVFRNCSGLPDKGQVSTARNMATLALALLRDFPQYYRYFSTRAFPYKGRRYHNHNALLSAYPGADGIKTGYTRASGYNLVASATRDGQRLIAVVLGGKGARSRDRQTMQLLDQGFRQLSALSSPATEEWAVTDPAQRSAGTRPYATKIALSASQTKAPLVGNGDRATLDIGHLLPSNQAPRPQRDPAERNWTFSETSQTMGVLDYREKTHLNSDTRPTPLTGPASGRHAVAVVGPYGVQVGAYYDFASARRAALDAAKRIPQTLGNARVWVAPSQGTRGSIFLARLIGLSRESAEKACAELKAVKRSCHTVAIGTAQQRNPALAGH